MMPQACARWRHLARPLACALLLASCVGEGTRTQLANAMTHNNLPKVAACWEAQSEQPDFAGDLHAVVSFDVAAGSGAISHATIHQLQTGDASAALDSSAALDVRSHPFASCLLLALNASRLGSDAWSPSNNLQLSDVLLHFAGPSQASRFDGPPRLVGPRADRCHGLSGHRPPRDAANIHGEFSAAQDEARRYRESDLDHHARALQRAYDLALELHQRLSLDAAAEGLSSRSAEHIRDEVGRAREQALALGARIGCKPDLATQPR